MLEKNPSYTVSQLNEAIKQMFDLNFALHNLTIKGEISNLKRYPNGHVYFSLKDNSSSIRGVMFYTYAKNMPSTIKDGDEVLAKGRVGVYTPRGEYMFYVDAMEPFGLGAQLLELELLKKKLEAEGLFDPSKKRKINLFAKTVGVISAANSAAMADIKTNLLRRNPLLSVVCFPSLVQGKEAPKDLLRALNEAKNSKIDTLIIGRGGGTNEDLSAFNDETLVREVAKFPVPVISAVGHEIDFTLIDFVADARASTPTGAAELATIDKREVFQKLDEYSNDLDISIRNTIEGMKHKLNQIKLHSFFQNPKNIYIDKLTEIKNINSKLDMLLKHIIEMKKESIDSRAKHLNALSPDGVLNRGYSIIQNDKGKIVKKIKDIEVNQKVKTILSGGSITSVVVSKEAK